MRYRPCAGCGQPIPALPGKVFGIACGCAYRHTLSGAARRKFLRYDPEAERRRKGGDGTMAFSIWDSQRGIIAEDCYTWKPRRRRRSTRKDAP